MDETKEDDILVLCKNCNQFLLLNTDNFRLKLKGDGTYNKQCNKCLNKKCKWYNYAPKKPLEQRRGYKPPAPIVKTPRLKTHNRRFKPRLPAPKVEPPELVKDKTKVFTFENDYKWN